MTNWYGKQILVKDIYYFDKQDGEYKKVEGFRAINGRPAIALYSILNEKLEEEVYYIYCTINSKFLVDHPHAYLPDFLERVKNRLINIRHIRKIPVNEAIVTGRLSTPHEYANLICKILDNAERNRVSDDVVDVLFYIEENMKQIKEIILRDYKERRQTVAQGKHASKYGIRTKPIDRNSDYRRKKAIIKSTY